MRKQARCLAVKQQPRLTGFITVIMILTKANSVLSLYPLSRRYPT